MLDRVTSSPTIDNKMASSGADQLSAQSSAQFSDITRDNDTLRRFLHGLPGVDRVGA
jgi:deoxyribose-phosphate aldolase